MSAKRENPAPLRKAGNGRDMTHEHEHEHFGARHEKTQRCRRHAAEAFRTKFSDYAIERERDRRNHGKKYSREGPCVVRNEWRDDGGHAGEAQGHRHHGTRPDFLMQDKGRERNHEHGIAAEYHGNYRSLARHDRQLIESHAERYADKTGEGEKARHRRGELPSSVAGAS